MSFEQQTKKNNSEDKDKRVKMFSPFQKGKEKEKKKENKESEKENSFSSEKKKYILVGFLSLFFFAPN